MEKYDNSRGLKPGAGVLRLALAVCCISLLLLAGCNRPQAQGPVQAPVFEAPVFAVNTTAAVQGQIQDYISLSGDLVPTSTVDIYPEAAGKVTQLYTSVGSWVNRNGAIIEIDPSRPGMTYQASVARSSVAGTVVAMPAQVGMTVAQSMPIARIAVGNNLEIRLYVAERFISKISRGLPCEVSLDAYPGEIFRGTITNVSPVVDPSSRTMEIRVTMDNPQSRLKTGMFAKVKIVTERKNNIVKLPAAGLIQRFGEEYVFLVETDPKDPSYKIARKQPVTVGINIDGVLEIQQGLASNDEVIVRGQSLLEDGVRINIIDRLAPLSAGY